MSYTEISEGPKGFSPQNPLARMTSSEYHPVRGASREHLAAITGMFRKISSTKIRGLFTGGIDLLVQEAKHGGNPNQLAEQLSKLLALVADNTFYLSEQEYQDALEALQSLLAAETAKLKTRIN